MTATQILSKTSTHTIRLAIHSRRQELLDAWLISFKGGVMDNGYGCGFWAERIRSLNDAAIEFGMGYSFDW